MSYARADFSRAFPRESLFDRLWSLPESWVEPPNHRRGGLSGVIRTTVDGQAVYIKKQRGHFFWSLRHPFGQPTALREYAAFAIVNRLGIETPVPLFCESKLVHGERCTILVTKPLAGYVSLAELAWPMGPAENLALLRAVAHMLAKLHRGRWQHSALYPSHIFVKKEQGAFQVALLDLEKMRRRFSARQASRHDLEQFLRRNRQWDDIQRQQFADAYEYELFGGERPSFGKRLLFG